MSTITLNGKKQEAETPVTISALLQQNNVAQPSMVSVQLNGEFVYQTDYDTTLVNQDDEVDFLYFMGGGQTNINQ
jgi:sulfur carrier protein